MTSPVLVHGMHTSSNFGDVLLTKILIDWLKDLGVDQLRLVRPSDPVSMALSAPKAGMRELFASDVFLLGGGGFFQRMDGVIGSTKTLLKYALPIFLSNLAGKRTAMIGVGLDAMPKRSLDWLLKLFIQRTDVILARDQVGYDYLKGLLGPTSSGTLFQCSDLVFALERSMIAACDREWAINIVRKLSAERVLAVHLSQSSADSELYATLIKELSRLVQMESDLGIVLIEDHPSNNSGQMRAQMELKNLLPQMPCELIPYPGVERLTALLGSVDAVLSDKLHVGLCAAAMGVMPFSLAKHNKNLASYRDIGIEDNCVLLNNDNADAFGKILERFVQHRGPIEVSAQVRQRVSLAKTMVSEIVK